MSNTRIRIRPASAAPALCGPGSCGDKEVVEGLTAKRNQDRNCHCRLSDRLDVMESLTPLLSLEVPHSRGQSVGSLGQLMQWR